jgi:hypothetical protein
MTSNKSSAVRFFLVAAMAISLSSFIWAQAAPPQGPPLGGFPAGGPPPLGFPPGGLPAPPASARQAAPIDLTGNWVSVVTEDRRFRMMTPPKGEVIGFLLTSVARAAAEAWDPAKDEAAGLQCKAYGAPVLMRNPGRAQISWQDDNTLKIDHDTGQQTRLLHFGGTDSIEAEPSWQGYSVAEWEREATSPSGMAARGFGRGGPGRILPAGGAQRIAQGDDHAVAARPFAQERRALQRERDPHRILQPPRTA